MSEKKELGDWGEQYAKEELIKMGLKFIARNFRFKNLEIDLIFLDVKKNELIIVEVKTRKTDYFGDPEEAIDSAKQSNLRICASVFMKINKEFADYNVRYDSYAIIKLNDTVKVRHIENAF